MTVFKKGDYVRILDVDNIIGGTTNWNNGDVVKVTKVGEGAHADVWLERSKSHECPRLSFLRDSELQYVELADKPKKSERITALETQVAELKAKVEALEAAGKYPNTARFERESAVESEAMDGILADIARKAEPVKSPNEQRADVIKRAKEFVTDAINRNYSRKSIWFVYSGMFVKSHEVRFIVNAEKRTVVALIQTIYGDVQVKAVAKCDPDDVFNADIGKAIALGRALGVDVTEFTKAVQPTEVVVGMTVMSAGYFHGGTPQEVTKLRPELKRGAFNTNKVGYLTDRDVRITDDTDAVYE